MALWPTMLAATTTGWALFVVVVALRRNWAANPGWQDFVTGIALYALPTLLAAAMMVFLMLVFIALPLTWLLRGFWESLWMGVVMAASGAFIAAGLSDTFEDYFLYALLADGPMPALTWFSWRAFFTVGLTFGAPTGFWWWFFYRRVLMRRAAVQN